MDDNVSIVHQHPAGIGLTLDPPRLHVKRCLRFLNDAVHDGLRLPPADGAADDEVVGQDGYVTNIEQQYVLALLVGDYVNDPSRQFQ